MKYYAHLIQKGEGCDYTIGCANTLITIEAGDDEEAKEKLAEEIREEYTGELELSEIKLFKNLIDFDLDDVYDKLNSEKKAEKNRLQHLRDKEDFERLRRKLGR